RRSSFNGAALWQRGKRGRPRPVDRRARLQWGRALAARKAPTGWVWQNARLTLQWGRALAAGKACAHLCGLRWMPSFNGAALWQRGKRQEGGGSPPPEELQWGRALAARKAAIEPNLNAHRGKASMGPRFGSAESCGRITMFA